MKHISVKDLEGKIRINKRSIADLIELTRVSPVATRLFLTISAYMDKHNTIITSLSTLSHILNLKKEMTAYGLRKLAKEGFIDLAVVKINHENQGILVKHDEDLYDLTDGTVWEVISKERASNLDIKGDYLRITLNSAVATGPKYRNNRLLLGIKHNLFFDKDINENEIGLSYWL